MERAAGNAVVFTYEDHRQVPGGGHVGRFVERAPVGGAVPEKYYGDSVTFLKAGGQGGAYGQTKAAAHDAVGAQHPHAEVRHVLAAALAPAAAGDLAVELRHHGPQVRALGNGVAVSAVGAFNVVLPLQTGAHAGGNGLLAYVKMHVSQNLLGLSGPLRFQLKLPDLDHGLIVAQQLVL